MADLSSAYAEAFFRYLDAGDEAGLEAAYALGRRAVAERLSVLDLAAAHHDAIGALLDHDAEAVARAGAFLAESLSVYEMTSRGFFEASQAAELAAEHSARLRRLAAAAAALNSSLSSAEIRRLVAEQARALTGARAASAGDDGDDTLPCGVRAVAVPLRSGEGTPLGMLAVADPPSGDFSEADEVILAQLAQMASVALENARLFEREKLIAATLERSLLSEKLLSFPGARLAARYVPGGDGSDVGGDWYDAMAVPGGCLAVTVGDVTGKGIHAAAVMGQLRVALRAYALEGHTPAGIIGALDHLLQGLDDTRMATTACVVFEPGCRELTFASGGHPPPLVVGPDGTARYLEGGLSLPLGVLPDAPRTDARATIAPGSTLLLYTDGLVEQRTRALDEGLDRLLEVAASAPADLDAFCDHLLEAMLVGGEPDDVAVLAVRIEGDDG